MLIILIVSCLRETIKNGGKKDILLSKKSAQLFKVEKLPTSDYCDFKQLVRIEMTTLNLQIRLQFESDQLMVTAISAKGLIPRDKMGSAEPYLKLYLHPDRRLLKVHVLKICKTRMVHTQNLTVVYIFSSSVLFVFCLSHCINFDNNNTYVP